MPRMLRSAQAEQKTPRTRMNWSALAGVSSVRAIDALLPVIAPLEDKRYRTRMRYDARGRLVETRLPMSGSTQRIRYTDDGLAQKISRETAAGTHEVVWEAEDFDHLGRPTKVKHGTAAVSRMQYDPVPP